MTPTRAEAPDPGGHLFALRLGLAPGPVDTDVDAAVAQRLTHYRPRLIREQAAVELSLTIPAADVWLAVLLAMAAVTDTGFSVLTLAAEPVTASTPAIT